MSENLKKAYSLETVEETIDLYRGWSKNYDLDFAFNNSYKSPKEVAIFYLRYSKSQDFPILDVGAGTGLVGQNLRKYTNIGIDAIDISKEMLEQAKLKQCYQKIITADLNKELNISDDTYGTILSAGTFTHGHLGPDVFDELIRIAKPGGLFIITIHEEVFAKEGFEKKIINLGKKIKNITFHRENIYGKIEGKTKKKDQMLIAIFRKKT